MAFIWNPLNFFTFCVSKSKYLEINKNLKFKKGVGIAIKRKETSS